MAWSDLAAVVQTAVVGTYGESAVYLHSGAAPVDLSVAYDETFETPSRVDDIRRGSGAGIALQGPRAFGKLSAFGVNPPVIGDSLTVRGVVYSVREVQNDGLGGALLLLDLPQSITIYRAAGSDDGQGGWGGSLVSFGEIKGRIVWESALQPSPSGGRAVVVHTYSFIGSATPELKQGDELGLGGKRYRVKGTAILRNMRQTAGYQVTDLEYVQEDSEG